MPDGRFISHDLGDSEKFAALDTDTNRVAYMLLITWSDAEGRFLADAVSLRGKLYTRLDWSTETVEASLLDMERVGLVRLYTITGKRYGFIEGFYEHQRIRRKPNGDPDREARSRLPAPPDRVAMEEPTETPPAPSEPTTESGPGPDLLRSDSGATPDEVQSNSGISRSISRRISRREEDLQSNGVDKTLARPPPPSPSARSSLDRQAWVDVWNERCGVLPKTISISDARGRALDKARQTITRAIRDLDLPISALDLFAAAVDEVARDDFYVEHRHGMDALLREGGTRVLKRYEAATAPGASMSRGERKSAVRRSRIMEAVARIPKDDE